MRYTILLFLLGFFSVLATGQEADIEIGCAPLEVMFSAEDTLQDYFWDFGDATNSVLQNPDHIYTTPGVYTVRLFDQQGGLEIGNLIVTVLPRVQAAFSADIRFGCAPLVVSFSNNSTIPPELLSDVSYEWVFGDGSTSTRSNPTHQYLKGGDFSVSLKIITPYASCDDIAIEPLYIKVPPILENPIFKPDKLAVCDPKDPIVFSVDDDEINGVTYTWDFGDGTTEIGYGPVSHSFSDTGRYFVSLTVSDAFGCTNTYDYTLAIIIQNGPPTVTRLFDDTICVGATRVLQIESNASSYIWSIASGVQLLDRREQSPTIFVHEAGNYNIFLKAGPSGCRVDTFFTFTAIKPNAGLAVSPQYFCVVPTTLTLTADDQSHAQYYWGIDSTQFTPTIQVNVNSAEYDSFFMHSPLLQTYFLTVEDHRGCRALDTTVNYIFRPDAYFIPSVSRGCAPLTINFVNVSTSRTEIITNSWIFGDGQHMDADSNITPIHVYEDPGEYYVRLIIENEEGCRDEKSTGKYCK